MTRHPEAAVAISTARRPTSNGLDLELCREPYVYWWTVIRGVSGRLGCGWGNFVGKSSARNSTPEKPGITMSSTSSNMRVVGKAESAT